MNGTTEVKFGSLCVGMEGKAGSGMKNKIVIVAIKIICERENGVQYCTC